VGPPRCHLAQREANGDGLLFDVPSDFNRVFDGDLKAAGIPRTDAQGHTLDIHPDIHRDHTFATLLARNSVSPATAQKPALRSSRAKEGSCVTALRLRSGR